MRPAALFGVLALSILAACGSNPASPEVTEPTNPFELTIAVTPPENATVNDSTPVSIHRSWRQSRPGAHVFAILFMREDGYYSVENECRGGWFREIPSGQPSSGTGTFTAPFVPGFRIRSQGQKFSLVAISRFVENASEAEFQTWIDVAQNHCILWTMGPGTADAHGRCCFRPDGTFNYIIDWSKVTQRFEVPLNWTFQ